MRRGDLDRLSPGWTRLADQVRRYARRRFVVRDTCFVVGKLRLNRGAGFLIVFFCLTMGELADAHAPAQERQPGSRALRVG